MVLSVAIIGSGPTGVYTLAHLIRQISPLEISLFEKAETAGMGMPFSPEASSRTMLANIASIEIPPIKTTYLEWLRAVPQGKLTSYGVDPESLTERSFTPRLLLGEYFRDQFLEIIEDGRAAGHVINIHENTEVLDIGEWGQKFKLSTAAGPLAETFDHVVLATGHSFPEDDAATGSYFPNPWSGLISTDIAAGSIGVMGTSLSGIDAAMAVATQHGTFKPDADDGLTFETTSPDLRITMVSRNGLLPEADFYCPIPYEDLKIMTEQALTAACQSPKPLDNIFELFRAELAAADPAYARKIDLENLSADDFADAYFAARAEVDPFRWARKNLAEVERNKAEKRTVHWRYAILRMHEQVEETVSKFSDDDRARFDAGLKRVFIDNYAAVPPESIRRLLALRDAGVLHVAALGDDYELDAEATQPTITTGDQKLVFDVFIDARGQKPMVTADLPFASLRHRLLEADQEVPDIADDYTLIAPPAIAGRVSFAAIPYLMHDKPFVQGITACAELGEAIARGVGKKSREAGIRRRRRLA